MVQDCSLVFRYESQQGFDWLFRRVKERMEQNHTDMDINFSVMVLGTNFWPLNPPKDGFIVPTDIQLTYDRFQKHYQQKHSGRKLTRLWNYSKNELQTNHLN